MMVSNRYESLLTLHPSTSTGCRNRDALADLPDRMTYRFRIDPNARWSDGQPVVADDVVATWTLMMDKGLQDPSAQLVFEKFDKPVAESSYIVRVTSQSAELAELPTFPAECPCIPPMFSRTVDGARYLKEYNYKMLPGSGPYIVNESDVVKGNSITIRRRNDYWAENVPTQRRSQQLRPDSGSRRP